MKHVAYFLMLFLAFGQTAFSQSEKETNEKTIYEYADGVTFTLLRTYRGREYSGPTNTSYKAEKGYEFVGIILDFKNESGADVEIDFSNFGVLDDDGQMHAILGVIQSLKLTNTDQNFTLKLKKGKEKRYILTFKPVSVNVAVSQLVIGTELFKIPKIVSK